MTDLNFVKLFHSQSLTVAKTGGDYNTIQGAIDAITDNSITKPYAIFIYPGTYTEDIVMEDFVTLDGIGKRSTIVIAGSVTFPAVSADKSSLKDLTVQVTATTDGYNLITIPIGSGTYNIDHCLLSLTSAEDGDTASVISMRGGDLTIKRTDFVYDFNGSASDAHSHYIIDVTGTSSYDIYDCEFDVDIADVDDGVVIIHEEATGTVSESMIHQNSFHLNLSHGTYTGISGVFWLHGAGAEKNIERNHVHVTSDGGGIGYIIAMDTDGDNGVINSIGNWAEITGFAANVGSSIGSGDVLNASFVRLQGAQVNVGAGTVNSVGVSTDGSLGISGTLGAPSATFSTFLKLTPTASPPSTAEEGVVYMDTDHHLYVHNGTTWVQLDN